MSKLTYERAKQLYVPYNEGQMRHLCALRDVEIDRLRAENAKLRELVRDMLSFIRIRALFSKPPTAEAYETFYKRAREMGVDE